MDTETESVPLWHYLLVPSRIARLFIPRGDFALPAFARCHCISSVRDGPILICSRMRSCIYARFRSPEGIEQDHHIRYHRHGIA
jgi:hypothetical protein